MTRSLLAQNIDSQTESLADVLRHQAGSGAVALAEAASLLRSRKRVVITGMGASLFASIPLEYFLSTQGIDAVTVEAGELLHYRRASLRDAVIIVVSRSGESIEVTRMLTALKGQNPIIGVSNEPQSTLARSADISILVGSRDDEIVAIQTYTGTLLAMHLLGAAVAEVTGAACAAANNLLPSFAQLVKSSMDALHQWDGFLGEGTVVYLLARGPSCASAHEGALLFNEVSKTAAVGMMAGSFRHGPVEVVDAKFLGVVFAPHGNTQDLNLALANDMARFGGHIKVIGPSLQDVNENLSFFEIPKTDEMLTPLFEIVPIQAAALRMAELKGIRPGSFRYAPRVAVDEARFLPGKEA